MLFSRALFLGTESIFLQSQFPLIVGFPGTGVLLGVPEGWYSVGCRGVELSP